MRRWIPFGGAMAVAAALAWSGVAGRADRALYDLAMRAARAGDPAPVREDVVVVGIDEAFLESVDEPLALSHRYLARFLEVMAASRARVVGLDVVLPDKRFDTLAPVDAPDLDYHRTLVMGLLQGSQAVPLVVAKAWDADRGHYRDIQPDYASVLQMQSGGFDPQGSVLLCLDDDDGVRRYPGADCQPDRSASTFAAEVAAAAGRRGEWSGRIDYRAGGEFAYVPLQAVFALQDAGEDARLAQLFEGRIVLLGAILEETDLVRAPVPLAEWRPADRQVPGVLVHAQILRNLLNDGLLRELSPGWQGALVLAAAAAGAWPRRRAGTALALAAAVLLVAGAMLALGEGLWTAPALPLLALATALAMRSGMAGWRRARARQALRLTYAGQIDADWLRRMARGAAEEPVEGPAHVAVLECRLPAHEAQVQAAGERVAQAVQCIHRHGGLVDAVSGTRVSAFFPAGQRRPLPEKDALEAACAIVHATRGNAVSADRDGVLLAVHSGDAQLARIDAGGRRRFTLLGDLHLQAARLLDDAPPDPITCTPAVADALGHPPFLLSRGSGRYGWSPATRWQPATAGDGGTDAAR